MLLWLDVFMQVNIMYALGEHFIPFPNCISKLLTYTIRAPLKPSFRELKFQNSDFPLFACKFEPLYRLSTTMHGLLEVLARIPTGDFFTNFQFTVTSGGTSGGRKTLHFGYCLTRDKRESAFLRLSLHGGAKIAYVMFRNKTEKREIIMLQRLRRAMSCGRDQLARSKVTTSISSRSRPARADGDGDVHDRAKPKVKVYAGSPSRLAAVLLS